MSPERDPVVRLAAHVKPREATILKQRTTTTRTALRGAQLRRMIKEELRAREGTSVREMNALEIASGFFGKLASFILIPMIFLQPILPLYAADESVTGDPAASLPSSIDVPPTDAPIPDIVPPTEIATDTQVTPPADTPTSNETATSSDSQISPEATSTFPDATTTPPEEDASTTPDVTTETPPSDTSSSGTEVGTTTDRSAESVDINATSTEEAPAVSDEPKTTEENSGVTPPDPAAEQAAREARDAQLRAELKKEVEAEFLKGCISYERSGYYCLNDDARKQGANGPENRTIVSVEEGQDAGGADKEIYVVKGDQRIQLTNNDWDDAFPAQDLSGEHVVWQGMKDGRWQIFYADNTGTGTPVITQVTDSKESNFNPKVDGEHIVWQGWVDENWEIFLATKRLDASPFASEHLPPANIMLNVGPEWEVDRLTENKEHDMFPSLHGDIVTWQAHEGDNWVVYAYSISQKTKTRLSSDGTKSEHPRFSITWEERDKEGGARLMSYDMATGEKVDLTSESERLPHDPFHDAPKTPISQSDQAALPTAGTGSSTPQRTDDDAGGANPLVP